jgi:hypothetical protein
MTLDGDGEVLDEACAHGSSFCWAIYSCLK